MTLITSPELLLDIERRDVPEIAKDKLVDFLHGDTWRRRLNLPSYGAVVMREFGLDPYADSARNWLGGVNHELGNQHFKGKSSGLHSDPGKFGSNTLYRVWRGQVDFLVVAGGALYGIDGTDGVASHSLFESDKIDKSLVLHEPDMILRTQLGKGDVLLFDHTLPHSFRKANDGGRDAVATYPKSF